MTEFAGMTLAAICQSIADDYQSSEAHHPNHVLIAKDRFEAMCAALSPGERTNEGVIAEAVRRLTTIASAYENADMDDWCAAMPADVRQSQEADALAIRIVVNALAALSPAQTGGTAVAWRARGPCGDWYVSGSLPVARSAADFWETDVQPLYAAPVAEGAREDSGSLQPQDAACVPTEGHGAAVDGSSEGVG